VRLRRRRYVQLVPAAWHGSGPSPPNRVVTALIGLAVAVA